MAGRGSLRQRMSSACFLSLLLLIQPLLVATGADAQSTKQTNPAISAERIAKPYDRGVPSAEVLPYWESLETTALGELRSFWHDHLGTPKSIYGRMADVSADMIDPEAAARNFLMDHAALFQLRSLQELRLVKLDETPGGTHLQFQQVYQGVRVYRGRMSVHINPRGIISTITNSYWPGIDLKSLKPNVSSETVYQQMHAELATQMGQVVLDRDPSRELVIYPTGSGVYLAWMITIPAIVPQGTWQAFYDAMNGERISDIIDKNYYIDGTGKVFVPNPVVALNDTSIRDMNDSNAAVPDAAYTTKTLFDLDGSGFLNGPFVNTQPTPSRVNRPTNDFSDLRRGDNGFEEVETYWAIDTLKRYLDSLGFFTIMNYSIGVNAEGSNDCNAFYSGFGNGMGTITLHSPSNAPDAAEDADVIWHEYGHAIMDNQIPDIAQNFDGQGEGFGDYMSAVMSNIEGPAATHSIYDPCLSEWFSQCFTSAEPACLRRTDNPPSARQWPRDRGEVHFTGQTWSATLYDIQQMLGRDTTMMLVLDSQFRLPDTPAMPESAEAITQADDDIFGGMHQATLNSIFTARGLFPQPYRITSPTDGDVLYIGAPHTITWSTSRAASTVKLMISRTGGGGGSFNTIADVPNTGSFTWTVTGPATTQAVLRIRELSNGDAFRDHSTGVFTISSSPPPPPTDSVTVTSPNGGDNWVVGAMQNVTWTSTGSVANVKIELSRSGAGGPFEILSASTPNDGSESVTVTGPTTTNALIRISDAANAGVSDISNSAFTISDPAMNSITVTSPNGGENWSSNSTVTIQWTSMGSISSVKVELSRNGGSSYEVIIANTPNDGSQTWTVAGAETTSALVRISDFSNAAVSDVSDGVFKISTAPGPPGGCPVITVVEGRPDAQTTVTLLYRFRDEVLARTLLGQYYTEQYYQFSNEVVSILAWNPSLLLQAQSTVLTSLPVIQSLVNGEGAIVTADDIAAVDQLLRDLAARASLGLRQTIERLRRDLRDPRVLAQFNVRVGR